VELTTRRVDNSPMACSIYMYGIVSVPDYLLMTLTTSSPRTSKNIFTAILIAGLVAGTMDGLAAIINFLANGGKKPESIFKYISSGLVGKKAYTGGNTMILLGVLLHYFIALSFTAFFFLLFPKIKWLQNNVVIGGLIYGLFVWVIMNRVVVPLSLIPPRPFVWKSAIINMLILMVCIGLPAALLAKKHYLYRK